jgi:hypothetical protein
VASPGGLIVGSVVEICVDIDARLFWLRVSAGNWNGSGTANPATGVGGINIAAMTGTLYPAASLANGVPDGATMDTMAASPIAAFTPWGA